MGAAGVSIYSKSSDVSDTACDIPTARKLGKFVSPAQLALEHGDLLEAHIVQVLEWIL